MCSISDMISPVGPMRAVSKSTGIPLLGADKIYEATTIEGIVGKNERKKEERRAAASVAPAPTLLAPSTPFVPRNMTGGF